MQQRYRGLEVGKLFSASSRGRAISRWLDECPWLASQTMASRWGFAGDGAAAAHVGACRQLPASLRAEQGTRCPRSKGKPELQR